MTKDTEGPAPDKVLNPKDPGDETRRRNRYQDVRAAFYILGLFDDEEGIAEIICEQLEDVLVKYSETRYRGIQIKTREDGAVPFKAVDDEVVASLQRFIATEKEFPDKFELFVFGCNCGFWEEKKNGSNLIHLLEEAKGKTLADVSKTVRAFLKRLCPTPKKPRVSKASNAKPSKEATSAAASAADSANPLDPQENEEQLLERALKVLQKVVAEPMGPLTGMVDQLIGGLAQLDFVGTQQTYGDLDAIADALIAEVAKASAKEHGSFKRYYFELCQDPDKARTDSTIDWKRFTRQRAEEVIRKAFRAKTPLVNATPYSADNLPTGTRNQQAKMTAGGVVIEDIEEAVQQRLAAEYVLSTWINKHGVAKANAQYQDLRSAVLTTSNAARDQVKRDDAQYGQAMLMLLKEKMQQLHEADGDKLHGVRYDQLLGVAGILTEECPLWWSEKFDLTPEVAK